MAASRRSIDFAIKIVGALLFLAAGAAYAQDYPNKPVRLLIRRSSARATHAPPKFKRLARNLPTFVFWLCRNCVAKQTGDDFCMSRQLRRGQMRIPPHHTFGFPCTHFLHYVK